MEVLDPGHIKELMHGIWEAEVGVFHEKVTRISEEDDQVSNFIVSSVLESLGKPAVVAPSEVAATATEEEHPTVNQKAHCLDENSKEPAEENDGEGGQLEGPDHEPSARGAEPAQSDTNWKVDNPVNQNVQPNE